MNRIAFIGGGNMATALIAGMIRHGAQPGGIAVAEPRAEALHELSREYGVATYTDNLDAAEGASILVLAVEPQMLAEVCRGLGAHEVIDYRFVQRLEAEGFVPQP